MKRTLALFLALTLSLSLLAGCGGQEAQSTPAPIGTTAPTATPDAEEPTTKVVVDGLGREVEIPWPVERAVVANRYNSELIRASSPWTPIPPRTGSIGASSTLTT